ncbi:UbiX family flavin prenyltransferase [Methanopyrus sp.]
MRVFIGVTGASGQIYAKRLIEVLHEEGVDVETSVTRSAEYVMEREGVDLPEGVRRYDPHDLTAPPASGTYRIDAYVVCPCTLHTLSSVAAGVAGDLIKRAAVVALKEGRPLVFVVRETPWPRSALQAALKLREEGAVILPACPAFYHNPTTVDDLVDYVVQKALDAIGVEVDLVRYQPRGTNFR